MKQPKTYTIIVFPDQETWNTIDGCTIKVVNEQAFEDLCADRIDAGDAPAQVELTLTDRSINVIGMD
jgi:hypothetical protein